MRKRSFSCPSAEMHKLRKKRAQPTLAADAKHVSMDSVTGHVAKETDGHVVRAPALLVSSVYESGAFLKSFTSFAFFVVLGG